MQGRAVVFPVLLTSLPYAGSFACKLVSFVYARNGAENTSRQGEVSEMYARGILDSIHKVATDILTWRNYVVVSTDIPQFMSHVQFLQAVSCCSLHTRMC